MLYDSFGRTAGTGDLHHFFGYATTESDAEQPVSRELVLHPYRRGTPPASGIHQPRPKMPEPPLLLGVMGRQRCAAGAG